MRAFVTGSTGFLGRRLIVALLARGYAVTALVRTLDRARSLPAGPQFTAGDVTRPASARPGMRGADVVFHLAGLTRLGRRQVDRERMQRINAEGARQVLALAGELGVPRVVCLASLEAYGDAGGRVLDGADEPGQADLPTEYGRTQRLALRAAREAQAAGQPVIIAGLGAAYGPGDASVFGNLLWRQAHGRLLLMAGQERKVCWTYVDDVAEGLCLAAERGQPGRTYFLAGPAHTYPEFLAALGRPGPMAWLPPAAVLPLARLVARVRPDWAETLRRFAPGVFLASAETARLELGWQARPLAEGLPPTLSALSQPG